MNNQRILPFKRRRFFPFIVAVFFVVFLFSACASTQQAVQPETAEPTAQNSETPKAISTGTPAATLTQTPTQAPTPMGGATLRVAYLSFNCEDVNAQSCLVVSELFSGTIQLKHPISDFTKSTYLSWSPDGRYLLYMDYSESYMNVMILDVVQNETILVDTFLIHLPGYLDYWINKITSSKWSGDNRAVAYRTLSSYDDNSVFVYSLENKSNSKLEGYFLSYYWLDDNKSLLEIKTGNIFNVESGKSSQIDNAYFMYANTFSEAPYVLSVHGDDTTYPDKISMYPYVTDLNILQESGTQILYDNEVNLAEIDPSLNKAAFGTEHQIIYKDGEKIILTGIIFENEMHDFHYYLHAGTVDELPFAITREDYIDEVLNLFSPDQKLYFNNEVLKGEDGNKISIIKCYDMETNAVINIFEFHEAAEETHDIIYKNNQNLAFYWEN